MKKKKKKKSKFKGSSSGDADSCDSETCTWIVYGILILVAVILGGFFLAVAYYKFQEWLVKRRSNHVKRPTTDQEMAIVLERSAAWMKN